MGAHSTEREFLDHYHHSSYRSIRLAAVIGLIIYDLHAVWDFMQFPEKFMFFWFIRLAIVTPVILGSMYLIATEMGRSFHRAIVLSTALVATFGIMVIHFFSHGGSLPAHATGIILQMLFCMTTLRMLTAESIIYSGLSLMSTVVMLVLSTDLSPTIWITNIVNVMVASAIGISATLLMEGYARRSFRDERRIRDEQIKADRLLENTFPIEIARRLKSSHQTVADYAPTVTVLFADLVGFTKASSTMEPSDLVENLDAIFTAFDRLTAQFRCEKIKTIGDAYMAVSGIPESAEDHAERIVDLAIAMHAMRQTLRLRGMPLALRIGIHSGPVVAGVIGKTRFAYDLWGDTVNTASRLESTCPINGIQISAATYQLVKHKVNASSRGMTEMKGKGMVETWIINNEQHQDETNILVEAV